MPPRAALSELRQGGPPVTEEQWVDADKAVDEAAAATAAAGEQGELDLPGVPAKRRAIDHGLDSETVDELLSEAHSAGD